MNATTATFASLVAELESLESSRRYSRDELEAVYSLAHNLYSSGKFEEALRYFAFLTLYKPTDGKYLLGLGSSQQMARRFEAAIQTYSFLTLLDPSDPGPTLRIGECLMYLGLVDEARDSLNMVVAMASASGKHEAAKLRAEGLLDALRGSHASAAATAD